MTRCTVCISSVSSVNRVCIMSGYRPTAVQAWLPCTLWEPSISHPIILVYTRGLAVFYVCVSLLCCCIICVICFFWGFLYFCSVFSFSTSILLVGFFWPVKLSHRYCVGGDVKPCSINQSISPVGAFHYASQHAATELIRPLSVVV